MGFDKAPNSNSTLSKLVVVGSNPAVRTGGVVPLRAQLCSRFDDMERRLQQF